MTEDTTIGGELRTQSHKALAVLECLYGKAKRAPGKSVLEVLSLSALRRDISEKKLVRARGELRRYFVDWNEIRVTPVDELEEVLRPALGPETLAKVNLLKTVLSAVFDCQNCLGLEHLVEKSEEEIARFLRRLAGVDKSDIERVIHYCTNHPARPFDDDAMRVAKRMGLVQASLSPEECQEAAAEFMRNSDLARLSVLFREHGKAVCKRRQYDCFECYLNSLCEKGRETVPADRRKPPSAARLVRRTEAKGDEGGGKPKSKTAARAKKASAGRKTPAKGRKKTRSRGK